MSCVHFDIFCANFRFFSPERPGQLAPKPGTKAAEMTDQGIKMAYELQEITPVFYPNLTEIGQRVTGNNFARVLGAAMAANDWGKLNDARRGANLSPPEIGIIYNGYVTKQGSVFSSGLLIEAWPDQATNRWPDFVDEIMGIDKVPNH
jgi:hypothetical protein